MDSIQTDPQVWLVTGGSQGLGLAVALAALHVGHKVLATARQPDKARSEHPEFESGGGIWIKLDVTQSDTQAQVDAAIREHGGGRIDVVVNNAGYDLIGPAEDVSDEEMLASFQTLFMGPFRIIKAALPYMRAQKSGTLVFNGSCLGMRPCPANAAYCAPKAAGDMLHEVLRLELRTFNIRTLILNSGLFGTGILANSVLAKKGMSEHYLGEGTVIGAALPYFEKFNTEPLVMTPGDPTRWGERVVELVDKSGQHGSKLSNATRVLLGSDSVALADQQLERLRKEVDDSREVAVSTDFDDRSAIGMEYLVGVAP